MAIASAGGAAVCRRHGGRIRTFTPYRAGGLAFAAVLLAILFGTVFAAVHHAEVIAERIGEPYGTLLLTLAVTIIEVALIETMMLGKNQCRRWRATRCLRS